IAGVWTGADDQADHGLHEQLAELTGLPGEAPVDEVVVAAHARLAKAPSMIVTATLDDALCIPERPNLPGTTSEWPNWSLALSSRWPSSSRLCACCCSASWSTAT